MADLETNKRLIAERHGAAQRVCLGGHDHRQHMAAADRHFLAGSMPAESADGVGWLKAWHSQTISPTFHGFGPMIAEGHNVVEEWETFIHGADGTLYNNHYCWVQRIEGGRVVEVREYEDSHHVWTLLGRNPEWPPLRPLTQRRQSNLEGLEITREYALEPALLCDIVATGGPASADVVGTASSTRAVVDALHDAMAAGDPGAVAALHADGYRRYLAGERPFGWDHLPVEDIYRPLVEHLVGRLTLRFGPMVADGLRAFQEMESVADLDDGTVYHNWHCLIHEVRDGLITQTREYLDTHHVWVALGAWADWADEPVPPLRRARRSNLPEVTACFQHRNPFLDLDRWGGALI